MSHLMTLVCLVLRALRPSRGLHAVPRVLRAEVRAEALARRAARVRRYAAVPVPPSPSGPGYAVASPAPGRNPFASLVPVVEPSAVHPPAELVRGPYRAWEAQQARARADRSRLGVAVLVDVAANRTEVPA